MPDYFIETSSIIGYVNGDKKVISQINDFGGKLTSSYICLAELYEGIYRGRDKVLIEKIILDFFKSLSQIYTVDLEVAKTFAKIRIDLKKRGEIIEDIDILIAATCIVNNLSLVTANVKHFSRIPGLQIL